MFSNKYPLVVRLVRFKKLIYGAKRSHLGMRWPIIRQTR